MPRSFEETSELLTKLYKLPFNGKKNGRFRIDRAGLAAVYGGKHIEQQSVDQIKILLSEKHGLLLIDQHDEFAVLNSKIIRRYRKATHNVLKEVLGISYETNETDEDE